MREIKFRLWEVESEQMVKVEYSDNLELVYDGKYWILKDYTCVFWDDDLPEATDGIKLMQYTGRKDSEGNEIYEGDILQSENYFRYQVVFKGDCWRCEPLKRNGFKNRFIGRDLKVIGNIYENPELLED